MKGIGLIILQCFVLSQCIAQSRYLNEIFDEVKVSSDIIYGRNFTWLSFPTPGKLAPIDLKMDIYEPEGDTLLERPMVLVFHDGIFLPPVFNGKIIGTKTDSSVVEICTQLARRGFTAAAPSYRLGWNPLAASQVELAISLFHAIYRGVQDGRTAIRFLKKNYADEGNEYHIDPNRITVWGNGAGAVISLNMVALSHIDEIANTTNGAGKFIFDSDGDGIPDMPMVLEEIHGDIEGKNLTIAPFDFLGIEKGDTTNYSNHPDFDSDFQLAVNVSGAVADIGWLQDNSIPIISFQSVFDSEYPYDEHSLVPHPGLLIFSLQGSKQIGALQENLGNNQAWKEGISSDDIYTQQAILHSEIAGHPYYDGLYPTINPANVNGIHEGVVIDWWDPNAPSPLNGPGMGLPWNEIPSNVTPGLSLHEQELMKNVNMSAEKARTNIDTIMNYFAPRACITLGLEECQGEVFTSVVEEERLFEAINIYPNPTSGFLTISTKEFKLNSICVLDMYGKVVKLFSFVHDQENTINIEDLPNGLYQFIIESNDAIIVRKINLCR